MKFRLLILASIAAFIAVANPESVQEVFDPHSGEESYQRRYVISVLNKAEDCYYIPEVRTNQIINFHFVVVNAGRSGQQLDISVKIRSPAGKLVQYINRKVEDQLLKYSAMEDGDYEICFNNRYSMMEVKKVFWQFEVEGAFDEVAAYEKLVNATAEYFQESSKEVEAVVRKVRSSIARARHQQWWLSTMGQKHQSRLEAVQGMIDRWSLGHMFVLFVVGITQLVVLRKLFDAKPTSHKLSARA